MSDQANEPGELREQRLMNEGADVCIHLSGRSINCRFTRQNRRDLRASRIGPPRLLDRVIAGLASPPRIWLNASAVSN